MQGVILIKKLCQVGQVSHTRSNETPARKERKHKGRKREREIKKMGMRGQTNQNWCYQPAEGFKKTDHRVKSYIYSETASFDIAF